MTHNIIKTHNYLLIVSDEEIKEGDWHMYSNKDGSLNGPYGFRRFLHNDYRCLNAYKCKKLISHLPLNNSPVLKGVPLLPPLEDGETMCPYPEEKQNAIDWHNGYNKAKEKYNADLGELLSNFYLFATNGEVCDHEVINEFIQSIQQSKTPVEFECESTQYTVDEMSKLPLGTVNQKPKTTTNSQGQTVLAGKYIY
jgi:hypothetical protein